MVGSTGTGWGRDVTRADVTSFACSQSACNVVVGSAKVGLVVVVVVGCWLLQEGRTRQSFDWLVMTSQRIITWINIWSWPRFGECWQALASGRTRYDVTTHNQLNWRLKLEKGSLFSNQWRLFEKGEQMEGSPASARSRDRVTVTSRGPCHFFRQQSIETNRTWIVFQWIFVAIAAVVWRGGGASHRRPPISNINNNNKREINRMKWRPAT